MQAQRNNWQSRVTMAAAFVLVQEVHKYFFAGLPPTDGFQAIYHGSAVLADFLLIYLVSKTLYGQVAYDLYCLGFALMVSNAVAWVLFTAEFPPLLFNSIVKGLGYAQLLRLAWVDNGSELIGSGVVRRHYSRRAKLHP